MYKVHISEFTKQNITAIDGDPLNYAKEFSRKTNAPTILKILSIRNNHKLRSSSSKYYIVGGKVYQDKWPRIGFCQHCEYFTTAGEFHSWKKLPEEITLTKPYSTLHTGILCPECREMMFSRGRLVTRRLIDVL